MTRRKKESNFKTGDRVWYTPIKGMPQRFEAVLECDPWVLGGHTEVADLCGLPASYGEFTGTGRTRVVAASTTHMESRS